jgi:hypothetical protein
MAGEIEVDDCGNLTRWLNKSGLYMPPRWAVGQAGLPFDTAWLFVSDAEVQRPRRGAPRRFFCSRRPLMFLLLFSAIARAVPLHPLFACWCLVSSAEEDLCSRCS